MPAGDVEVGHVDGAWRVRIEGGAVQPGEYDTKDKAVDAGRKLAKDRGVELIIKDLDGRISRRDSEGNDPRNIPG